MNDYSAEARTDVSILVNSSRLGCIEEYILTSDRSVSYVSGVYTTGGSIHRLTVTMVCNRDSYEDFVTDFYTLNGCSVSVVRNGHTVTLSNCTVEKFRESVSLDNLVNIQITFASNTRAFANS